MSLRTPILTTPSVYCAKAELLARSAAITIMLRVVFILFLHAGPAALRSPLPLAGERRGGGAFPRVSAVERSPSLTLPRKRGRGQAVTPRWSSALITRHSD